MPIFNMIAFSGTFFAITKMPGFPTDRSVNWFMPLGLAMDLTLKLRVGLSQPRDCVQSLNLQVRYMTVIYY